MLPRKALARAPQLRRWLPAAAAAAVAEEGAWSWQRAGRGGRIIREDCLCRVTGKNFTCPPREQPLLPFQWASSFSSFAAQPLNQQQQPPGNEQEHQHFRPEQGTGWSMKELLSWPNTISMSRLVLGPVLAWVIVEGYPGVAFCGMMIGGATDWLDGYVARRIGINSVLGSYLDPLADKVLVASVALSMAYTQLLHPGLVALMVARDAVLIAGAFVYRARSLNWKWTGWGEFFRISDGGAPKVQPIFISKVNTVLQLALICGALLEPSLPGSNLDTAVWFLSWSVGATTIGSWMTYGYLFHRNGAASVLVKQQQPLKQKKTPPSYKTPD